MNLRMQHFPLSAGLQKKEEETIQLAGPATKYMGKANSERSGMSHLPLSQNQTTQSYWATPLAELSMLAALKHGHKDCVKHSPAIHIAGTVEEYRSFPVYVTAMLGIH